MSKIITHTVQGEHVSQTEYGLMVRASHILVLDSAPADITPVLDNGNIPRIGDPHQTEGTAVLVERNARATDPFTFLVSMTWKTPELEESAGGLFSMSVGTVKSRQATDADGDYISTTYTYPTEDEDFNRGRTETRYHQIDVQKPLPVLRWTRVTDDYGTAVLNVMFTGGRVNSSSWQGIDAGQALCTHAEFEPLPIGGKWREIYEFTLNGDGWKVPVVHINEITGKPVKVSNPPGDELAHADVYISSDFNNLSLEFI